MVDFVKPPVILRGPLIYEKTVDTVVIWWQTDIVGENNGLSHFDPAAPSLKTPVAAVTRTVRDEAGTEVFTHTVKLINLTSGLALNFEITATQLNVGIYSFKTLAQAADVKFVVIGESRDESTPGLTDFKVHLDTNPVDVCLGVGGYVGGGGQQLASWESDWLSTPWGTGGSCLVPKSTKNPFIVLDAAGFMGVRTHGEASTFTRAMMPIRGPAEDTDYFSVDLGYAQVVGLDTNDVKGLKPGGAQRDWLLNTVVPSTAWTTARYRIILAARPFRTTYWNVGCDFGTDGTDANLFAYLHPLVKTSGADLVIYGSSRSYQRGGYPSTHPAGSNTVHHVVCGSIGAPLHTTSCFSWEPPTEPGIVTDISGQFSFLHLDVKSDRMKVESRVNSTGVVLDSFTIVGHTVV